MIVLDASVAIELLLNSAAGQRARERLSEVGENVHAPHLIDPEVAQALRRYFLAGHMAAERGREALADFVNLPLHRHRHDAFLLRIWQMRDAVTAYDAAYLALAEALDAPLLTRDEALADASQHRARVEVLR